MSLYLSICITNIKFYKVARLSPICYFDFIQFFFNLIFLNQYFSNGNIFPTAFPTALSLSLRNFLIVLNKILLNQLENLFTFTIYAIKNIYS